ncbi:MAG TPA: DUF4253 domain-containing protein [Chitinimonas sp.]
MHETGKCGKLLRPRFPTSLRMTLFKLLQQTRDALRRTRLAVVRDEQRLRAGAQLLAAVSGGVVRPYATRDYGRGRYEGACSVLLPPERLMAALRAMRVRLPDGLLAFVGTSHSLARPAPEGVELVVAAADEQFDILRIAATVAARPLRTTEQLIAQLRVWDAAYGIDIWQAETDTVQLQLRTLPRNLAGFAQEVRMVCPATVEQGTGSVAALAAAIRQTRALNLWWR